MRPFIFNQNYNSMKNFIFFIELINLPKLLELNYLFYQYSQLILKNCKERFQIIFLTNILGRGHKIQNKIYFLSFKLFCPKPFEIFQKDFITKCYYQLFLYVQVYFQIFSEIHPFLYHLAVLQLQKIYYYKIHHLKKLPVIHTLIYYSIAKIDYYM